LPSEQAGRSKQLLIGNSISTRRSATEHGFRPDRVGVIGSSAGGPAFRPDWSVLCYPVIALYGPAAHPGSARNLLGPDFSRTAAATCSPHNRIDADTPPAFLWHTLEDAAVPMENSLLYAEALRKAGVPFDLHITERGRHGLGVSVDFDWPKRVVRWLEEAGRIGR